MLACYSQLEMKSKTKMSFHDLKVIREDKAFTTSAYHKPTFSVVINIFTAFYHLPIILLLSTYAFRWFLISLSLTKLHTQFLKILKSLCKILKTLKFKETTLTVEKNRIINVLPCLGSKSLQTGTNRHL